MATDLLDPKDQTTVSLVGGIIDDMQRLVKQQVHLTRKEITEDVHRASQAVQLYAVGGAVLFLGVFILCLALIHLVHGASIPGSDTARIPLWAAHAIVGGPLAILGGSLVWMGRNKFSEIQPLQNPATQGLKENVQWATNSK